jgi:GT2 family glycosyltransferase
MPSAPLDAFIDAVQPVVVVYGHDYRDVSAIRSLETASRHFDRGIDVLVFDNSPVDDIPAEFDTPLAVQYLANPTNLGLGPCYNEAAKRAALKGKSWLLLLDQDAVLPAAVLEQYAESVRAYPTQGLFCPILESGDGRVLSPYRWRYNRPFIYRHVPPGVHATHGCGICNNGLLVSLDVFRKIGGYHERIKLDFADLWFFRRFAATYATFAVIDCRLRHDLSSLTERSSQRALERFVIYCRDARLYAQDYSAIGEVGLFAFLRALKLAVQWRRLEFISTFFRSRAAGGDHR